MTAFSDFYTSLLTSTAEFLWTTPGQFILASLLLLPLSRFIKSLCSL